MGKHGKHKEMTPTKQTILHEPQNGKYGNCAQAAYASLFDLSIEDVPHFADGLDEGEEDGKTFNQRTSQWLSDRGYGLIGVNIYPEHLSGWEEYTEYSCGHFLISGMTERNTQHVVVGKGGKVVHDPHPSDAGLLPPTDEHPWIFEFIVKLL